MRNHPGYVVEKLWAAGAADPMFDRPGGQWQVLGRTAFHDLSDLAFVGDPCLSLIRE
jgi:hypothetical protein